MSMLQDLERARALEIDALVTAVQELGRLAGVSTPVVDVVLALVQERGAGRGTLCAPGILSDLGPYAATMSLGPTGS